MIMETVIEELKEQLRFAELDNPEYAKELQQAIDILTKDKEERQVNEKTLTGLLQAGNSYFARNEADYMIVYVEGPTPVAEVIVNPKENFDTKLAYYKKAYNEDLTLKNNPEIRITNYLFVTREEMEELF